MNKCVQCNNEISLNKPRSIFCSKNCGTLNSYYNNKYEIKRVDIQRKCLNCGELFLYKKHKSIVYCSSKCHKEYKYIRDYFIKPNRKRVRVKRGTGEKQSGNCINCGKTNPTYRGVVKHTYCSKECMDKYRYKNKCKICGDDRNTNSNNALCIKCGASYRKIYKWNINGAKLSKNDRDDLTRSIRILSENRKELYELTSYSKRN